MAEYAITNIKQPSASHNLLVGLPLALVAVLALSFIVMHPGSSGQAHAKASKSAASTGSQSSHPKPLNLQPISPASPMPVSSAPSGGTQPTSSEPDSNGSGHGNAAPQASSQNHGNNPIEGVVNSTAKSLLH